MADLYQPSFGQLESIFGRADLRVPPLWGRKARCPDAVMGEVPHNGDPGELIGSSADNRHQRQSKLCWRVKAGRPFTICIGEMLSAVNQMLHTVGKILV